jgi:hypothetical protein
MSHTKANKCIICGKAFGLDSLSIAPKPTLMNIDKTDCYIIYKKLLGIYGADYIKFLSSYC